MLETLPLVLLPFELQLHVLSCVEDWHDVAALLLALPRTLGIYVMRAYPVEYTQEPLLAVALSLALHRNVLNDALLLRYACDARASPDGCRWLSRAVQRAGWGYHVLVEHVTVKPRWNRSRRGLRMYRVGVAGCERIVRVDDAHYRMTHFYKGEKGAERLTRTEHSCGRKRFYEGERGAERLVRVELPNGRTWFYQSDGALKTVRMELPCGKTRFYEGERSDLMRLVRVEFPDGRKWFTEGERGAERLVRVELPCGKKQFFTGERSATRLIRIECPDGKKKFYEGDGSATRQVHVEFPAL